jgi:ubiquinone/menaquinone biosynthesis C-methylase UbiE
VVIARRVGTEAEVITPVKEAAIFQRIAKHATDLIWKLWYPVLTRIARHDPLLFLNYGYAEATTDKPLLLAESDEANRANIQLYHRVVSGVDLSGLRVLEVSCGHGGGAAYVAKYLKPRSLHGVDRNAKAIELCRRSHHGPALTFSRGNAQALQFSDCAFDAVINIEASHCYPDVPQFFSEVRRVLTPDGHFLYADFRDTNLPRDTLHQQLEASGLEIIHCDDISQNVVKGMEMNTERYLDLIRRLIPKPLRKPAADFAGVEGSAIYKALQSGEAVYLCYHLRKRI